MGWSPNHGRIKERYNPKPNAAEARHETRMYDEPCFGCGRNCETLHHTMLHFAEKRWKRDHRYQLPLCKPCHVGRYGIHGIGCELAWLERVGKTQEEAVAYMLQAWAESELIAKYEGRRYG